MREDVVATGAAFEMTQGVIFAGVSLDDFHLCALAGRALSIHAV